MTSAANTDADETISVDDYVACTIEGRVISKTEDRDGVRYRVEYFDNAGERRTRNLWRCEIEHETPPTRN